MKRFNLKSTSAIAMSAMLAIPGPLPAASHKVKDVDLPVCGDPIEPPCLTEDGAKLTKGKGKGLDACEIGGELPCRTEDGFVKKEIDAPMMDGAAEAEGVANPEPEVGETLVEDDKELPEDIADMADEAPADDVADGAMAEVEDVTVEGDAGVETEAGAQTDAGAAAEIEVETEEDASGSDDGSAASAASDTADAEAETDDEIVQVGEDGGSDASGDIVQVEEPADGNGDMTDAADEPTEVDVAEETAPETTDETVVETSDEPVESEQVAGAGAVGAGGEPSGEDKPAAAAAAAASAEVDADADAASEGAEVETEEVTEETARSSDEDFETAATGDAGVTAGAESNDDGDKGLSTFEKALLLGLGAAAVGSILNNGDEVVSNSGDRVVVRRDGELRVLKDDDALLRQPGNQVRTETFDDGSTRTTVTRQNGTKIVTIRAADGRVLRRTRVFEDGRQVVLFDDTAEVEPVDVSELPALRQTNRQQSVSMSETDEESLRRALAAAMVQDTGRVYSLRQVRQIREVRELAPEIELDAITFATGSAAIQPSQAEELTALGRAMRDVIEENPGEVFLIEGHTDTVGDATYNLALSDRRAETVALALSEYFDVPPENIVTQGYGESQLKVEREGDIRANRRATVRRITPLLRTASN